MTTISHTDAKSGFLRPRWTSEDGAALYALSDWGNGYFRASEKGRLLITPDRTPDRAIDLYELVEGLGQRGVTTPVLLRFPDILADRMRIISGAFNKAIADHDYTGRYRCVYPIKVNQQRQVVEGVRDIGAPLGFG